MRFCVLGSGSRGNATYLESGGTGILIDGGMSGKELQHRLAAIGVDLSTIAAVLVTHEHNDHIQGVGVLSRRFNLPVFMSSKTEKAAVSQLGNVRVIKNFECGSSFMINNLSIHPFS